MSSVTVVQLPLLALPLSLSSVRFLSSAVSSSNDAFVFLTFSLFASLWRRIPNWWRVAGVYAPFVLSIQNLLARLLKPKAKFMFMYVL